jgi:hypothetical protein
LEQQLVVLGQLANLPGDLLVPPPGEVGGGHARLAREQLEVLAAD